MIRAITFDCAGTLVDVRQTLPRLIVDVAHNLGVASGWESAGLFDALYRARLSEFQAANRAGEAAVRSFYIGLARDWLGRIGADRNLAEPLEAEVSRRAFGPETEMFAAFPDALPCLLECRRRGMKVGVISNWDVSLHQVLRRTGLAAHIDVAVASLEFGVEKPDPRIFESTLQQLGVRADEAAHVGDDLVDDMEGAMGAGMDAVFLNRLSETIPGHQIGSLADLFRSLEWIG